MKTTKNKNITYGLHLRMKAFRIKHSLTQKQFAEKIGYSCMMISSIEINKSNPSAEMLAKMCNVFPDFDIHYILIGDKEENINYNI